MDLEMRQETSTEHSTERSIAEVLKRLLSSNVDKLFWENFEEVSLLISSKIPNSHGPENEKRWVLGLYNHVCRKAGGEQRDYVQKATYALTDAILHPQSSNI